MLVTGAGTAAGNRDMLSQARMSPRRDAFLSCVAAGLGQRSSGLESTFSRCSPSLVRRHRMSCAVSSPLERWLEARGHAA